MKSVLYVAAALMIGASIYGFVDYNKTSRHKEFKTMYDEPVIKEPVVINEKKQTDIVAPVTGKKEQGVIVSEETVTKPVKIKKKRKINYESFSRAPLREKVEIVNVVIPETKQ